jgi:hypothetical protein
MAGYSARQQTYTTGDTITAADTNDEFTVILASFDSASGHAHDGTSGEGPLLLATGALNSGSITSGFGNIDNGTSNITSGGIWTVDVDGSALATAGALTFGVGNDAGLYWSGSLFVAEMTSNHTNASLNMQLIGTTSGSPAIGIGTGLEFVTETSASNNEIGAKIEAITTSVSSTAENFDLVFEVMTAGSASAEVARMLSTGDFNVKGDVDIASGKSFAINNVDTLSATSLGSAVVTSSLTTSALTTVGALNSGSITSGFGTIDIGTSNFTTGGIAVIDVDGTAVNAAGSVTMGAGSDAGLWWDGTNPVWGSTAALTNSVQNFQLNHQTSGTPANGIGTALSFAIETAAGNTEVGARIEAVATDVDPTNEDIDLVFYTMLSGDTATEVLRLHDDESATFAGAVTLGGAATLGGDLDCNGSQIQWSQGADVASQAALPVLTDGNYFDVTGTGTITSINTTGGIGTQIKLHFDGILTLTHDSTDLILPGGANITTAAGDEAEFIEYASGDYRCTNYTKASGVPIVAGNIGQHTIWVPAAAMEVAASTAPATSNVVEIGTSLYAARTMDFATGADDFCYFGIQMPKSWDAGTLVCQFVWSATGTTANTVLWAIAATSLGNDEVLTTAFPTPASPAADTNSTTADDIMISAEVTVTVGSTPTAENYLVFEVSRDVSGDTLAEDARLHGIKIHYTIDTGSDT